MSERKPMGESRTIQSKLVLPPDTNHIQSIFGGKVLAYIDEIAAICAMKHGGTRAAITASIDSVDFVSPALLGDMIELEAIVTSVGRTSMEVFVSVHSKNLVTGEVKLTTESFCTMVAVDDANRPIPVADVYPETEAERRLFDSAPARRELRQQRRMMKR
ncbi:acyl-CoA thioesterase [Sporosarcina sp. P37]|uniref:acyl-CoA thioesterase n=1 Tax=unclassified Sporosarcina TaxID=2647733 RepID=UPI0009BD18C6|nr:MULTISPECIES: acyl-CoA thioesterase [unclassified Sporosarcina]ARD48202.1 acyl-CoA thioesterase [Sporosarcina sp. P33]ARK24718.1 acyl-CoA thioesterase [Sporosarcina sp. P37]PID19876.1 acyl-CoA thioesterase [Sporosarcina sp. P35]